MYMFSDVYVYGGSTDGLKNVDTTEVLRMGAGRTKDFYIYTINIFINYYRKWIKSVSSAMPY